MMNEEIFKKVNESNLTYEEWLRMRITGQFEETLMNRNETLENKINQLQSNWNSLREWIKWRPIEEYDENKYDWVLVKYYDGDYECVPTVAERRKGTNKWYDTNNNEIIFEVKYFFDMQLLDKMNELEGKDNNGK